MEGIFDNIAIKTIQGPLNVKLLLRQHIEQNDLDKSFSIGNLSDIIQKKKLWDECFPRVEPFYAVKCNDSHVVLSLLAKLGIGFDCASQAEIQKILELGVKPSQIIYSNTCKAPSYVKFAASNSVDLMTFDSEAELYKIKKLSPNARLLIRILPPDNTPKTQIEFGNKFGIHRDHIESVLQLAFKLELNVIGVSFHVWSERFDEAAYVSAITLSRHVFDVAKRVGYEFSTLDIGGGYTGASSSANTFKKFCNVVRPALDRDFPASSGVRIIAEPGRYFVASAFTLAVKVIGKRVCRPTVTDNSGSSTTPSFMYTLNDGTFGSFNSNKVFRQQVTAIPLYDSDKQLYESILWGPACTEEDCITRSYQLPEMDLDQWLYFPDMGAYVTVLQCEFNGMPKAEAIYVINRDDL